MVRDAISTTFDSRGYTRDFSQNLVYATANEDIRRKRKKAELHRLYHTKVLEIDTNHRDRTQSSHRPHELMTLSSPRLKHLHATVDHPNIVTKDHLTATLYALEVSSPDASTDDMNSQSIVQEKTLL